MDRMELILRLSELLQTCKSKVARARKLQARWTARETTPNQMVGQKRTEAYWSRIEEAVEEALKIFTKERT